MKKSLLFVFAAASLLFTSCGRVITPDSEKITGSLDDFYEVVNKEYPVSKNTVNIEINCINQSLSKLGMSQGLLTPSFTVEFIDKDGNTIATEQADASSNESEIKAIAALSKGETATIKVNAPENAVKFVVGSTLTVNDDALYTIEEDDESNLYKIIEEELDNNDNPDKEAFFTIYESVAYDFLDCLQKSNEGDTAALKKYEFLLEIYEDIEEDIFDREFTAGISEDQWSRLNAAFNTINWVLLDYDDQIDKKLDELDDMENQ